MILQSATVGHAVGFESLPQYIQTLLLGLSPYPNASPRTRHNKRIGLKSYLSHYPNASPRIIQILLIGLIRYPNASPRIIQILLIGLIFYLNASPRIIPILLLGLSC